MERIIILGTFGSIMVTVPSGIRSWMVFKPKTAEHFGVLRRQLGIVIRDGLKVWIQSLHVNVSNMWITSLGASKPSESNHGRSQLYRMASCNQISLQAHPHDINPCLHQ